MGRFGKIDWEDVYAEFDGEMQYCDGAHCKNSCCSKKRVSGWGGPVAVYRTSFAGTSEFEYQGSLPPSLDQLGVDVTVADVARERGVNLKYLINECLEDGGRCKLEGRKPLNCRLYPFSLSSLNPLDTRRCSRIVEIARDQKVVQCILRVRQKLGLYEDEDFWLDSLDSILRRRID